MDIYKDTPWLQDILGTFYKSEFILAQDVNILSDGMIEVLFRFPKYDRTLEPLGGRHVSDNQFNQALMEGLFLCIGVALKQGFIKEEIMTFECFMALRGDALYREKQVKYKKQVFEGESTSIIFSLRKEDIKNVKSKFSTATIYFKGSFEGHAKVLIPIELYVQKVLTKNA